MKVMKKKKLLMSGAIEDAIQERLIAHDMSPHSFIINLRYSFQSPVALYLIFDYMCGGDLNGLLNRAMFFKSSEAAFYCAELLCALEHLHKHNIAFRDLKPGNILIDGEGHLRLGDFGLAKSEMKSDDEGATTYCGTLEYMAPEIIIGYMARQKLKGNVTKKWKNYQFSPNDHLLAYGKNCDSWSLGILLYEMLYGTTPFVAETSELIEERIVKCRLVFPTRNPAEKSISREAKDLIRKLLESDPKKRLKMIDVRKQPFFSHINWKKIEQKQVPPPFIPLSYTKSNYHYSSSEKKPITFSSFGIKYLNEDVIVSMKQSEFIVESSGQLNQRPSIKFPGYVLVSDDHFIRLANPSLMASNSQVDMRFSRLFSASHVALPKLVDDTENIACAPKSIVQKVSVQIL